MKIALFLFFVIAGGSILAQKSFTLEEAVMKGRNALAPKRLKHLQFTKVNGQLSYVDDTKEEVLQFISSKGEKTPVITLEEFNKILKENGKAEMKNFPFVTWVDAQQFKFLMDKSYWSFDLRTKAISDTKKGILTEGLENAQVSTSENLIAFTKAKNLFIRFNGQDVQVTKDGSENIVYGEAVHRNEFGIDKGIFISPKENAVAFYRMDQSMVTDYPIINWSEKPAKPNTIKYPFAGEKSHHVTLGIYHVEKGNTVYVKTSGDPEQYLTNIAWNPDGSRIYIAIVNRAQSEMNLNEYNAETGEFIKTLITEKDEKYIEPLVPMQFVKNNPKQFVCQSNRDGYKHLYLYDASGKLIKQLTKGNWEIKAINGFDSKGENLFFHCNITSPVNQDFCGVNLKSGRVTTYTKGNGFHSVMLNEKGTFAIDQFSNTIIPRVTSVIDLTAKVNTELFFAPNPIAEYALGKLRLFSIKNKENTDLYCRMFLPVGFDSTKKYPVVVYLYNGPHSQLVTNSWLAGADLWYHYMAQKGFIVFTLDGRGTDNRGKAFSQAIHRQAGTAEMEDQLCGVDYLKSLSYVDQNRMGVHGWSYGGFMTTSLMTRHAGVFKAAVAGGPVIDWSYYEIMYTERYMDSPQENKEGYEKNNLLNNIHNLKGKLLVIHGTDDDVVVWQHSIMLLKKAVEKGIQLDYFVYPGHLHNVSGKDRVHLMQKISDYFIEHL